ncbi:MAG: MoaD/ThiS family protein [Chloroflexota bacterium]
MRVQVRLFGTLRRHLPDVKAGQWYTAALPDNATVGDLLTQLGVAADDTKQAFVNDVAAEYTQTLQEGDQVGVFPPVSGGA